MKAICTVDSVLEGKVCGFVHGVAADVLVCAREPIMDTLLEADAHKPWFIFASIFSNVRLIFDNSVSPSCMLENVLCSCAGPKNVSSASTKTHRPATTL